MQAAHPKGENDFLELHRWAATTPDAAALVSHGQAALTYAGLWDHIRGISEALRRAGVQPGTVVVLALGNGASFVTAALAITQRSACAPFDLSQTRDECVVYLRRLRPSALVFEQGSGHPVVDAARELGLRLIPIRSLPDAPAGVFSLEEVENAGQAEGRQTDAVFVLQTSATTDVPKLVPWTRFNVLAAVGQDSRALELTPADRFLSLMPLCHGSGLYTLLTQLFSGGGVFCTSSFEIDSFLTALEQFRPTWFSAGPTVHRVILAHARRNPEFFRRIRLRFVRTAGASPEPGLMNELEALLGAPVIDGYGLTEIVGATRSTPVLRKPGSVGRSLDAEMAILGDSGNLLPPGMEGEVVFRGPMLMSGYLDDPEANRAAFWNGWFRTGDIGRLDDEGYLYLIGRRKEIINRGGKKIIPVEPENVLATHGAVAEVAAFPVPHRTLGEDVAAAVVLREGADVSELELRRYAAERLAAYKVPRRVVFVDRIPRTSLGKPKRSALAEQFRDVLASGSIARPASPEPHRQLTEAEAQLLEIWRRILGVHEIGVEDNFFDLGGDSLTAALMLSQAAGLHPGQPLPEAGFFDQPNISALARMLEQDGDRSVPAALPNRVLRLREGGSRIPLFCISNAEDNPYQFRHLSRGLGPEQPFTVLCPPPPLQQHRALKIVDLARQSAASIRALRKHGPYLLAGYCFGGVIAAETAAQLLEEGEDVALLVLFDTPAPGYPKIARNWSRYAEASGELLRGLARGAPGVTARQVANHLRALARIATGRFRAKATLALTSPESPHLRSEVWSHLLFRDYAPRALSTRIVHFLAADEPVSTKVLDDPRLGWRDLAPAGFETRTVAGDHASILDEDNAAALAAELERVLRVLTPHTDARALEASSVTS